MPENISDAVAQLHPMGLDLSSGVETDGRKTEARSWRLWPPQERNERVMSKGRFGIHGGQYIPETLMNAVIELETAYDHYKNDPDFVRELTGLFNDYAGRPSGCTMRRG